ncbi:hypothetical protein AKJ65_05175 [candidate division MSBL1 archaeon SCGC-AAA259E19]|uniref:site-specific DNA-methyltransferase (adenine-specific) n=1 Tax=candidate division MSBL1 archaeon SCGC-AAA259E19 TaxID=1698264 RepID=A0A133UJ07_9EURY|nr:hypothetical protein AKJ65_05175 [candidate division MSBL1 archaeon SCGC-AAA259E19]
MPVTEDTITDRMADFLRNHGVVTDTWETAKMPNGTTKTPDLRVEDGGVFYGEAEWKKSESKGWAQAHDLSRCIGSSGSFLIVYPNELKKKVKQKRLSEDRLEALEGFEYKVAFLREDGTDVDNLTLSEIPSWIDENIHQRKTPHADFDQIIDTLNLTVRRLARELEESPNLPNLFKNILGPDASGKELRKVINDAAAYLLINQIAFYRVLSKEREDLPILDPYDIKSPEEFEDNYFDKVLEIDYSPVFGPSVAPQFSEKSVDILRETVSAVYGLRPERINRDVLGKVFHSFIPLSVRKKVAAYYTKNKAAEILSNLAIKNSDATVMDPACGSGTLLVSSYNRKKELLKEDQDFKEEDHRRFMSRDITGIDVMPFAAHLSTINLSLQAPLYETERVRIGIEDSTKLHPGEILSPLSRFVPEEKRQRKLEQFEGGPPTVEGVDTGTIGMDAKPGKPINLHNVDLIIMNPPFTRQETIADFSKEYKNNLEKRFSEAKGKGVISRRMNYCSYFLLLGDRFLEDGGRMAVVLPAPILRKDTTRKLREDLLKNYNIEYIIAREDEPNFSEDTDLREILFILRKKKSEDNNVNFVILRNYDEVRINHLQKICQDAEEGTLIDNYFELRKIKQNLLNERNLFLPISTSDYQLKNQWEKIKSLNKFKQVEDLVSELGGEIKRGIETARGGSIQALSLNSPKSSHLKSNDLWITKKITDDSIVAEHREINSKMEIPRKSLTPSLRRLSGINKIDISNQKEFVVRTSFPKIKKFLSWSKGKSEEDIETSFLDGWNKYVSDRTSNLSIARRFDLSAKGTGLFSFFSDVPRAPPGVMWSIPGIKEEYAKILSIWINSTINALQIFLERVETRGTWMQIHKYVLNELSCLSPSKISQKDSECIKQVFQEIKEVKFPPFWKQLVMNCEKEDFSEEEIGKIDGVFEDFKSSLGKDFKPRRKMDKAILSALGMENKKEFLRKLYPGLLKEIATLKKMMS